MALEANQKVGPYSVVAPLGAGGMGEVWLATDTRLGRDVALKTVPEAFTSDLGRLSRFEREARILAALNHPNIAQLYGLEEHGGHRLLVMECVQGEDLAHRLKRGPLPLDEALAIARQVSEALEEAHGKGIVHRDLKPANIKVTPEGKVKVLDFGLAKAWDGPGGSSPELSHSPTATLADTATAAGVVLAPRPTCRPSRREAGRSTSGPTSGPSGSCSSRCSRATASSGARPYRTPWPPS